MTWGFPPYIWRVLPGQALHSVPTAAKGQSRWRGPHFPQRFLLRAWANPTEPSLLKVTAGRGRCVLDREPPHVATFTQGPGVPRPHGDCSISAPSLRHPRPPGRAPSQHPVRRGRLRCRKQVGRWAGQAPSGKVLMCTAAPIYMRTAAPPAPRRKLFLPGFAPPAATEGPLRVVGLG